MPLIYVHAYVWFFVLGLLVDYVNEYMHTVHALDGLASQSLCMDLLYLNVPMVDPLSTPYK